MKKAVLILSVVVVFLVTTLFVVGVYQKPIPPDIPQPSAITRDIVPDLLPGATLTSPVTITGKARGTWYFEGSFPVYLTNWDGLIVAQSIAKAQGDWMTEEYVPFSVTISFPSAESPYSASGTLIFKKDNPSGLPEYDGAYEVPVILGY